VTSKSSTSTWQQRAGQFIPALEWLPRYRRDQFSGDLIAGIIVAVMLIPQGMAYAMLAGLPPQAGLYASIIPLVIYGLMGTSRPLSVAPVAIVSLMTASAIAPLADERSSEYIALALTLAMLSGVMQVVMGFVRAGVLVAFLSHPVLSGFINAAALVIMASQARHFLGMNVEGETFVAQTVSLVRNVGSIHVPTALFGIGSLLVLLYFRRYSSKHFSTLGISDSVAVQLSRAGTLITVALATVSVWLFSLDSEAGLAVTGDIPSGLPGLTLPDFTPSLLASLIPAAFVISLVGFMESISVAKTLASRNREKVDANQELVALGSANLGAAFTGGYPVTGGLSRSVVNDSAGAQSGMASILTGGIVLVTVLFLTPLFTYLPRATLAAVVLVAVIGLLETSTFRRALAYSRPDLIAFGVTFIAVLSLGIEIGIAAGVVTSIALFLWHTSQPHVAELGRVRGTNIYRNVLRHETEVDPNVLIIRIDENLYFANTNRLEQSVWDAVSQRPEVFHLVLVGSAVNSIDTSALETLEELATRLKLGGITMHLAAFKGPILDRLHQTHLMQLVGSSNVHLSVEDAVAAIESSDERELVSHSSTRL
jgi:sulfate permease, SulP family